MRYYSHDKTGIVRVLEFLKSHNTEYLSGQDLSDVLKISRVAIWKHIRKLDQLGYVIKSDKKLGYKLESDTDALLPWEITFGLDTELIGRHAYYYDSIESTQSQAARIAHDAPDGTVIVAQSQTMGRGRGSRRWISPQGGIWLSVILHPSFDFTALTLFPLAASLALSEAIKDTLGVKTELKWPNDITLGGKKVAGMLVDASLESSRIEYMVLGAGINFDVDAEAIKDKLKDAPNFYGAASLARDKKIKPRALVQAFFEELESLYLQMNLGETRGIVSGWTRLSSTIGRDVTVNTVNGAVCGKATRIDPDGALVLSKNGRTSRVIAGDVAYS